MDLSGPAGGNRVMDCSVNEIESLAKRAARGAGLPWGLAEEAAKAARWLAARRLPTVPLVTDLLRRNDGVPYEALAPDVSGDTWTARSRDLCPLIAGAALSDRAEAIAAGASVTLAAVSYPLLLAAFLGRAAAAIGQVFELRWPGATIRCLPEGPHIEADGPDALQARRVESVTVRGVKHSAADRPAPRSAQRVEVSPDDWAVLKSLAHRTYVPATDESRLRGAGAGLDDND